MDTKSFLQRYWHVFAIIIIIFLSMYVRLLDYRWQYLRNIDSYAFYRQMDEIIQNGGVMPDYDNLVLVPEGSKRAIELYPYQYLAVYSYTFFKIFLPNLQLWQYLIYFPAFLASLAAIPTYFIGKTLFDRRAGVLAAFFIVFDISNISRSLGGDPDSDAIMILMGLVAIAMFLITYKYISEKKALDKKALVYTILTGIALGVWGHSWIGYWYVIWLITGMIILKLIIDLFILKNFKSAWNDTKHIFYSYFIFMSIFILLFIIPFYGVNRAIYTFTGPIEFQVIKQEEGREFPNVYISVAELQQSGGPKEIIERTSVVSGPAVIISPFFMMIYSLIYLFYSYYKKKQHLDTLILLLIWFLGPFIATIVAVRFSMLFSAPMAIGSAIILSKLLRISLGEDKKIED